MNVLVYGGSGYIGSRLIPYLSKWHTVSNWDVMGSQGKFEFSGAIIHLACLSNNDMCERNPALAKKLNEDSLAETIKYAKGIEHFIYASSVAAYGNIEGEADETYPLNPTTLYGKAKQAGEEMLKASDLPYTITRCASVCGYSPRMRYDLMVNKMTHDAATKGVITVNGGEQRRSHITIDDVCEFYGMLLDTKPARETFNVVGQNQYVLTTAHIVADVVGRTEIAVKPRTDDRSYAVSGRKAKEVLGFEPQWSIKDAVISNYLNTLYDRPG